MDFFVPERDHSKMLVQACESLADPQTLKRETSALNEAMAELGLNTGAIVTRNQQDRIEADSGVIEVTPAWRFLLNVPEKAV